MLEAAGRREFDVLIVDDLSRLTRDSVECERDTASGVSAAAAGKPIAAVNLGRTRAHALLTLKGPQCCSEALSLLLSE